MKSISDDINDLFKKYIEKFGKSPRRFNYDQWNSVEDYKKYLENELNK